VARWAREFQGCLVLWCPYSRRVRFFRGRTSEPTPPGKLVDLGGHKLHVNCTGKGSPTGVVENGLGDFSFDWSLVQAQVSSLTRICTYERAGYAWSDPGPKPRTFSQLNLELRDALNKLGEQGPFVLDGHSFGGPVVRNFAITYPDKVAGVVLVDAGFEGQRVGIGSQATMRLGDGAKGLSIPPRTRGYEGIGQSFCAARHNTAGASSFLTVSDASQRPYGTMILDSSRLSSGA